MARIPAESVRLQILLSVPQRSVKFFLAVQIFQRIFLLYHIILVYYLYYFRPTRSNIFPPTFLFPVKTLDLNFSCKSDQDAREWEAGTEGRPGIPKR